jgi:hypothetical protein
VLIKVTRTVRCFGVYRVCHCLASKVTIIEERRKCISVDPHLFKSGEILGLLFFLITGVLPTLDSGIIVVRIQAESRDLIRVHTT